VGGLSAVAHLRDAAAKTLTDRVWANRAWAAILLAIDPGTCSSILAGRRVRAGNLDAFFFRRALRGGQLPDPEMYLLVSTSMLDAIVEAGPIEPNPRKRWQL
jgi:hypothetical protein